MSGCAPCLRPSRTLRDLTQIGLAGSGTARIKASKFNAENKMARPTGESWNNFLTALEELEAALSEDSQVFEPTPAVAEGRSGEKPGGSRQSNSCTYSILYKSRTGPPYV